MDSIFGLGLFVGIVIGLMCSFLVCEYQVKPIDVYRGKTTLEITYRDSVAIDSVVVYKMK